MIYLSLLFLSLFFKIKMPRLPFIQTKGNSYPDLCNLMSTLRMFLGNHLFYNLYREKTPIAWFDRPSKHCSPFF